MINVINSSLMKNFKNIQEFSRTPENVQGQQDVFQESRTRSILIANSRTILGAQGRVATLNQWRSKGTLFGGGTLLIRNQFLRGV